MKIIGNGIVIILLIIGCSKRKQISLYERTENFKVSECREDCGIDSIGIRTNKISNGDLFVRLGYIVNCSWESGYLKSIINKNDTLLIELERPHDIDTLRIDTLKTDIIEYEIEESYPLADCDCFFYFDFSIKNFRNVPKSIRISDQFKENKCWDERSYSKYEIEDVEEITINKK
ncbi:hypothetical protein [uncultured Aquimarina sp.]|uniref:hypothetical protein n=1 Tax=uncultured Aquimarina sp. TaxID=575652 RepID=UPI002618DE93|nr:hypothetical protein [uncultured Aquimarina sp.]